MVRFAFLQVRMKRYLEMRGADSGRWKMICALPALWVGLLYDDEAQAAAYNLVSDFTDEEHEYLRNAASKHIMRFFYVLPRSRISLLPLSKFNLLKNKNGQQWIIVIVYCRFVGQ